MAGLAEADSAELKTVLLSRKVSKDTLIDKKQFLASRAESGSMAVLGKSSKLLVFMLKNSCGFLRRPAKLRSLRSMSAFKAPKHPV